MGFQCQCYEKSHSSNSLAKLITQTLSGNNDEDEDEDHDGTDDYKISLLSAHSSSQAKQTTQNSHGDVDDAVLDDE